MKRSAADGGRFLGRGAAIGAGDEGGNRANLGGHGDGIEDLLLRDGEQLPLHAQSPNITKRHSSRLLLAKRVVGHVRELS